MIKSVTYLSGDKKSYELSDESDIQTLDTSVAEGSVARVTGKITAEYELKGGNWVKTAGGSGGGGSVEPLNVNITPNGNSLVMDKTAITIYNAFIGGTPIVLYVTMDSDNIAHPFIVGIILDGGVYTFNLSIPQPISDNPNYYRFAAQATGFPSYQFH